MKNTLLILFLLYCLTGCNDQKLTPQETVTAYYSARNEVNFNKLKTLINDSITLTAGDYVMPYDQDSFYEVFKWDSIFKPSYKIVKLEAKNKRMTCQYRISFKAEKISKIEELECKDADWATWAKEVEALVGWTKVNHPELDGFINGMTMKGAQNYLKAIELFEAAKNGQ